MPAVNRRSSFEALTPVANHAKPTATISAPVRFPGRRHHANSPVPMNDQPTNNPTAAATPRSSVWSLSSTSARNANPAASPAPASATSASRNAGSGAVAATGPIMACIVVRTRAPALRVRAFDEARLTEADRRPKGRRAGRPNRAIAATLRPPRA
jgi:hypothetical protein